MASLSVRNKSPVERVAVFTVPSTPRASWMAVKWQKEKRAPGSRVWAQREMRSPGQNTDKRIKSHYFNLFRMLISSFGAFASDAHHRMEKGLTCLTVFPTICVVQVFKSIEFIWQSSNCCAYSKQPPQSGSKRWLKWITRKVCVSPILTRIGLFLTQISLLSLDGKSEPLPCGGCDVPLLAGCHYFTVHRLAFELFAEVQKIVGSFGFVCLMFVLN